MQALRSLRATRSFPLSPFPIHATRQWCFFGYTSRSVSSSTATPSAAGGLELTFLGSSSQGGARRFPSSLALRLRAPASSEVWLFDAGEGCLSQLQRSTMRVSLVRNIFLTHLHGDHLYGLPSLVLSVLRSRLPDMDADLGAALRFEPINQPLDVYGPQGTRAFLRMALGVAGIRIPARNALRIHELSWPKGEHWRAKLKGGRSPNAYCTARVRKLSYEGVGRDIDPVECSDDPGKYTYHLIAPKEPEVVGQEWNAARERQNLINSGPGSVVAAPVLHTVPTFAFAVTENVITKRFDKDKLRSLGIPTDGSAPQVFQDWLAGRTTTIRGREVLPTEVLQAGRSPRRVCVVGDTYDASGAVHVAEGTDVLVHEATNVAAQSQMAKSRGHSSTIGATAFAKRAKAKRLIMNHSSVAYSERKLRAMESEARAMFGANRAFVARDLSVFSVPTADEDCNEFVFRQFAGSAEVEEVVEEEASVDPFPYEVALDAEDDGMDSESESFGGNDSAQKHQGVNMTNEERNNYGREHLFARSQDSSGVEMLGNTKDARRIGGLSGRTVVVPSARSDRHLTSRELEGRHRASV